MDRLEQIRNEAEAGAMSALDKLAPRHRRRIKAAINRYGSVAAIPDAEWAAIRQEMADETFAVLLLLLTSIYGLQSRRVGRSIDGPLDPLIRDQERLRQAAGPPAELLADELAGDVVDGIRDRLGRRVDDAASELNQMSNRDASRAVSQAVDEVFGGEANSRTVVTRVTGAVTVAQRSAAEDVSQSSGRRVVAIWRTERDARVCPICRPLDGLQVGDWEQSMRGNPAVDAQTAAVIMDQLGPPAHPNCRCELRYEVRNERRFQ